MTNLITFIKYGPHLIADFDLDFDDFLEFFYSELVNF